MMMMMTMTVVGSSSSSSSSSLCTVCLFVCLSGLAAAATIEKDRQIQMMEKISC
jgi:hypothetical protein